MPIYEYTCKSCHTRFEQLQRTMTGETHVKCPDCGSSQTSRVLSVFAVGAAAPKSTPAPPGMCGRCGGPGPCAMD
jgi:putative FmdB family regulatory protein